MIIICIHVLLPLDNKEKVSQGRRKLFTYVNSGHSLLVSYQLFSIPTLSQNLLIGPEFLEGKSLMKRINLSRTDGIDVTYPTHKLNPRHVENSG